MRTIDPASKKRRADFFCKFSPQESPIGLTAQASRRASDKYCGDSFCGGVMENRTMRDVAIEMTRMIDRELAEVQKILDQASECNRRFCDYRKSEFEKAIRNALVLAVMVVAFCSSAVAETWTNDQIADAIYKAEGGAKTSHPYGILAHYKVTTPRQACINTIAHAKRDWDGKGDFIEFLGSRYCPVGAENDPTGLNKNWVGNVMYFLQRG